MYLYADESMKNLRRGVVYLNQDWVSIPIEARFQLAFLTLCDLALNPPFLGGKMIELGKFCFIKTKFEPNLSCFSK